MHAAGAIGTAEFSGARLCDVLAYAGLEEDTLDDVEHIQFEGLDSDVSGTCYGASIPASKAASRSDDVILAYEMNGRYEWLYLGPCSTETACVLHDQPCSLAGNSPRTMDFLYESWCQERQGRAA